MTILGLILLLILLGVGLLLINKIPMDQNIKTIINIVIILVVVLFVLSAFGILDAFDRPLRMR